eukprot:TRINITY_DN4611_c0_g1_i1.p1 TRINITY_DN4611_c0_g1~~TRINITY_DN4611_c0_g1_i1.p1  ORF type:complete len:394 (+),score=85.29 TRINITY_DN4611_c0_g1_i1:39-1184(+)
MMEAWSECRPERMRLPASKLPLLLPAICLRVPRGMETSEKAQKLNDVFKARGTEGDEPSLFEEWLRPRDAQVQFLYFWRAFTDAAYLVEELQAGTKCVSDVLGAELDALRDTLLRDAEKTEDAVAGAALVAAVNGVASSSSFPRFWTTPVETAACLGGTEKHFSLEELAAIMLPWIQEASTWEQRDLEEQLLQEQRRQEREDGLVVNVHVYDVSQEEKIQKLNRVLANEYSPLKLGGVFHAGVEVMGLEWSFGASDDETRPGVSCCKPQCHPMHHYRQTVVLGKTTLSEGEIGAVISSMLEEYPGDDYDLLRRNCVHFAEDFSRRLQVGGLPGWVCRLANIGAGLETAVQKAKGIPGLDGAVDRVLNAVLPAEGPDSSDCE